MKLIRLMVLILLTVVVVGCNPKPAKKSNPDSAAPAAQATVPAAPAKTDAQPATTPAAEVWTCPMHPEVKESKSGKCPKCGMNLVKAESKKK